MDTATLVKDRIEDGRKLIGQLLRDGFDVTVAFWILFLGEETGPRFYIASKTVDEKGLRNAVLAIHDSLHRNPVPEGPWYSVSDISGFKLVGATDALAKDVLAFRDRFPGMSRFKGARLGSLVAEELYIYPPAAKSANGAESGSSLSINVGTAAEPEFIDLGKVPLVTILRDPAGASKVELFGGGKPRRALEGEEAQRFIAQFDLIREKME